MKTNSLMLGAAVLMLATACSNDEVVKVAENSAAIGFSSFVNNSTRATDLDMNTLKDLKVWGITARGGVNAYAVFGGDLVNKTISNSDLTKSEWKYDNTRYWIAGNAYTFSAIAPASAILDGEAENDAVGAKVKAGETIDRAVTEIAFNNNGEIDLLYDAKDVAANNDAAAYQTVGFNLRHILSRVKFAFTNGLADGYTIKVTGVTIENAPKSGTFTAETEKWTINSATGNYSFIMPEAAVAATKNATSESTYLLPNIAAEYTLKFNVEMTQKDAVTGNDVKIDDFDHSVTLNAPAFQNGYSYLFKTTINKDNINPEDKLNPIEFDVVAVEKWVTEEKTEKEESFNLKN